MKAIPSLLIMKQENNRYDFYMPHSDLMTTSNQTYNKYFNKWSLGYSPRCAQTGSSHNFLMCVKDSYAPFIFITYKAEMWKFTREWQYYWEIMDKVGTEVNMNLLYW